MWVKWVKWADLGVLGTCVLLLPKVLPVRPELTVTYYLHKCRFPHIAHCECINPCVYTGCIYRVCCNYDNYVP